MALQSAAGLKWLDLKLRNATLQLSYSTTTQVFIEKQSKTAKTMQQSAVSFKRQDESISHDSMQAMQSRRHGKKPLTLQSSRVERWLNMMRSRSKILCLRKSNSSIYRQCSAQCLTDRFFEGSISVIISAFRLLLARHFKIMSHW